jgi:integrase
LIPGMPRPRPPFISREVTRHGRPVWYVRRNGKRIRLRAEYGTPEFEAEYQAALARSPKPQKGEVAGGTLAWLVERYRETGDWQSLSLATKRQRENILKQVLASAGDKPIARITTDTIAAGRDRRIKTPFQARHFLDTMRGLFRWAAKAKLVKADPTAGVEDPAVPKTEGFPVWTEEHVSAYEKCWPIGTRQRVWLDVLLYTGLRRGDAVRFGKQHVRDSVGTIKTEKTGTEVTLPILPVLAETLAAGPCGDLTFIVTANGRPFTKESFGNAFKKACRKAGIANRSAHGLRKIAATRAADNGATEHALKAIFGWTTGRMAGLYTRDSDRRRLARGNMHLLVNDQRTSIPSPEAKNALTFEKEK